MYPVREDSRLLARFAQRCRGLRVLEICCGRGLASLQAARAHALGVVATDLNPAALSSLRRRARSERLPVEVVRTDLARGVRRFHRILANPPYLPTLPKDRDPDPWENLALDGGRDGCAVTARILRDLSAHLLPGGTAFLVVSSRQSPGRMGRLRANWRKSGGTVRTVVKERWGEELLSVWELRRGPRRTGPATPGSGGRRPARRRRPVGSNPGAGSGRTSAPGAA